MASEKEAYSSKSSDSNYTFQNWKYDAFLSFRGKDTRKGFTDHLYSALRKSGFGVFRDKEGFKRGETISEKLKETIERSRFAIVVVSRNYASSWWCLDELQHILATRNKPSQQVLPIFYQVSPSDVRHQGGSFGEAFDELQKKFQDDKEKIRKWRDSLTQLADLSGWVSEQWYESQLIESVVEQLWNHFHVNLPHTINDDKLIGIDWRIREIEFFLSKKLDEVKFVGIWGMGGVGKTTLAGAIYEKLHDEFDFHCFLANVREVSERFGLASLQRKLVSHLRKENKEIEDIFIVKNTIKYHFRNKKLLLILDDVSSIDQLESLAGSMEWFGAGSRVLITTRDVHLLRLHHVDSIYEVTPMNKDESLQLFHLKAFTRDQADDQDLLEKSKLVISYAEGLPLALCVLGSFFCGRSADEWEKSLDMLKEDSNNQIFKILKISYDALSPKEKAIFLDIACFFNIWGKDEVTEILESSGLPATIGIPNLIKKSLLDEVEVGYSKYIKMHNLIQDMGRSIVREESPVHVERRSRLWSTEDIVQVLERDSGTDAIEGIVLPFSYDNGRTDWNPNAFSNMSRLRILIISSSINVCLPFGLKDLPCKLKVLDWHECPLQTLPLDEEVRKLVHLRMKNSKIKRLWHGGKQMENLKFLDLSHSKQLTEAPQFSRFQKLERLVLEGCKELVQIDPSLGQLKSLVEVNLKDCKNLKSLPRELEMASLREFVLCGCTKVKKLPNFGECMKNLLVLDVKETNIAELPESLGSLTNLETLDLRGCQNLVSLPHNIQKLKCLKVLDISNCSNLSKLPKSLNGNKALEKLDASGTTITEVPSSIGSLEKLKILSLHGLKKPTSKSWIKRYSFPKGLKLPTSIFSIKSLEELDLSQCNIHDGFLPNDLNGMSSLWKLDLSGNNFTNLPTGCISKLLNLRFLYLNSCPRLQLLPKPSPGLDLMDARGCTSLPTLSEERLLHLFASIDQGGQYAEWKPHRLNANSWASLSIKTFSVTIPGSEIPLWFQSQKSICQDKEYESSIIVDVPPSDWLGFALCTVLENDMFYSTTEADQNVFCWRYYFVKASYDKFVFLQGRDRKLEKPINFPHLWILFGQIGKQTCSSLSMDYSRFHLKFDAERKDGLNYVRCGWRVMSKMDFESLLVAMEVHENQENAWCHEAQEQGQRNFSDGDQSYQIQTLADKGKKPEAPESSAPMLEDEVRLNDSLTPHIMDNASDRDFAPLAVVQSFEITQVSTHCCEAEEQGQQSLSPSENLNDSQTQFMDDASLAIATPTNAIDSPSPSNSLQPGPSS
ncbi:TMV resistance protein N-like [Prosopis cineraria]|uniref:TMV resistance protein N-like n=1 Tax=Prosopis cineraria TaxID=364024 RepID=UPI00241082C5|nr:TMV resistance protein N-like [Prosopis cineraria]